MIIPATQKTNSDVFHRDSVSKRCNFKVSGTPPFLPDENEDSPALSSAFRNGKYFPGILYSQRGKGKDGNADVSHSCLQRP